ncbi:conjugal transfer protein TraD [Salmonella enterica subsp. enterica]|nr:conjugal transfer protein TraD [Salmonella enterica subsp. enterica serovar Paratyphi A]
MQAWQMERRTRTRKLIELGGLVVKSGIVDIVGDDRAIIYGAMIWLSEELNAPECEGMRALWARIGRQAFANQVLELPPKRRMSDRCG